MVRVEGGDWRSGGAEDAASAEGWNMDADRVKCEGCRTRAAEEMRDQVRLLREKMDVDSWIRLAELDLLVGGTMSSIPIDSETAAPLLLGGAEAGGLGSGEIPSSLVTPLNRREQGDYLGDDPASPGYRGYDPWDARVFPPPVPEGEILIGYHFHMKLPTLSDFVLTESGQYWLRQDPVFRRTWRDLARVDQFSPVPQLTLSLPQAWFVAIAAVRRGAAGLPRGC